MHRSDASRRENAEACLSGSESTLFVIARSDSDEAIYSLCCPMDCFAGARNDGIGSS
jgi:hypothetical protein